MRNEVFINLFCLAPYCVLVQLVCDHHLLWLYRPIQEWQSLLNRLHLKGVSWACLFLVSHLSTISEPPNCLIKMFITFSVAAVLLLLLEDQRLCFWMSPPQEWTLMPEEALGTCYWNTKLERPLFWPLTSCKLYSGEWEQHKLHLVFPVKNSKFSFSSLT